jgi:hypothetical protein
MSAERPSTHPLGYWLGATPVSYPAHAWPDWLLDQRGQGMSVDPRLVPGFQVPEGPANSGPSEAPYDPDFAWLGGRQYAENNRITGTPTPHISGNLPPPRAMPYPEGAGREVTPDLYLTQPWGAYTNSLPGARGWEQDDTDFAMRQRRIPPGGLF